MVFLYLSVDFGPKDNDCIPNVDMQKMTFHSEAVSFSVLLNGSTHGFFKPSRGLRQGDPLSPFLFILASEVLSRLILAAEGTGFLHGVKVSRSAPSISHLLFADDIMIFSRANRQEVAVIGEILSKYSRWSGQRISYGKSALYRSENSNPDLVVALCDFIQVKAMSASDKYLGLPLFVGRSRKKSFEDIKAKVLAKVAGWKGRAVSQAGRTTLIKSVATTMPIYCMSSFLLPRGWCEEIDCILKDFW